LLHLQPEDSQEWLSHRTFSAACEGSSGRFRASFCTSHVEVPYP
jgi:hypothetical protein